MMGLFFITGRFLCTLPQMVSYLSSAAYPNKIQGYIIHVDEHTAS